MSAFSITVDESCVCIFESGTVKDTALSVLVEVVAHAHSLPDMEALRRQIRTRETDSNSSIGSGVAIPHVYTDAVSQPVIAVGVSKHGIEGWAPGAAPVHIVVLFVMPNGSNKVYLGLLAQLAVALKTPNFAARLIACESLAEIANVLNESGG